MSWARSGVESQRLRCGVGRSICPRLRPWQYARQNPLLEGTAPTQPNHGFADVLFSSTIRSSRRHTSEVDERLGPKSPCFVVVRALLRRRCHHLVYTESHNLVSQA